ncbi:MAG: ABC transporter ATP-binding protein [Chloroflexi bacterium]|nr:ABC transporter ATP-binding protein [Chloroflexota bacterium]MBI5704508.1 ABC transporter ATP-binding protein [Chloroflexota bacterium]GER78863.1 ABC transporter ATP-binding protein [Candidatus Denitrolinea symbiosum]
MDLVIDRVGKKYSGSVWGLKDFSLRLGPGILGLLGPNGAGKSTLMNILATIMQPTEGRVLWNGIDILRRPDELRKVLGYLPQSFGVYPNLSAQEFLGYLAALKGLDARTARRRIEELLQLVNLTEARKRPLGGYSGGMKQRIGIAQALLNDPQLLIVDEPTVGLDPEERVRFRNLIADLAGERIVILSTHIVSDVEATATQIVLVNHGRLLMNTLPETLLSSVENRVWEWTIPSQELMQARQKYLVSGTLRRADGIQLRVIADDAPDRSARRAAPTFEDAYLKIISANGHSPFPVKAQT